MGKKMTWNVAKLLVADNKQSVRDFTATIKSVQMTTSSKDGSPIANIALVDASSPDKPIIIEVWNPTMDLTNLPPGSILSVDRAYVKTYNNANRLGVSMFFHAKPGETWPDGRPKEDSPAGIVKINNVPVTGTHANGVKATGINALDRSIAAAGPGPAPASVQVSAPAPLVPAAKVSKWAKPAPPADTRGEQLGALYGIFERNAQRIMALGISDAEIALLQKIESMPVKNDFTALRDLYKVFESLADQIMAIGFLDETDIKILQYIEGIL